MNRLIISALWLTSEMLEWASLGVAMGNAPDVVRQHAGAVTEAVDQDGTALVLEALLGA